jgi:TIR domain
VRKALERPVLFMGDPDKAVFISYRQKLSPFVARPIFENLTSHGYDVFMDVESIDSGSFGTIIFDEIAARAHFLPMLSGLS